MKDKINEIVNYYGIMPQVKYWQSEVFELNEAIIKGECKDLNEEAINHIAEEIADNYVFLLQFMEYYKIDKEKIFNIIEYKVNRQIERISKE